MEFKTFGNPDHPTLVCIPGLLGGAEDFRTILPELSRKFYVIVPDPNSDRRANGLTGLTPETMREVSYDSTADEVAAYLSGSRRERAYLVGISLGGKVVYDFATRYCERFSGGVVTDVGLGAFDRSELYLLVDGIVTNAPLHLPWDELKKELASQVSDRNLRSLIQSQIHYPDRKPPAAWKIGMKHFSEMLRRQGINDQFESFEAMDARLHDGGRSILVMNSETHSGIDSESLERMKGLLSVRFHPVSGSTHFLHITHKDLFLELILKQFA